MNSPTPTASDAPAGGADEPMPSTPAPENAVPEALTPEELAAQWEDDAPPPAGSVANLAASLVALAIGVGGIALSVGLGLGDPAHPKPGTWPLIVSLVITVLAVAQLVMGRRGGHDGEKFSHLSWFAAIGLLTLAGLVAAMPVAGFEIPAVLLSFVWMKFLGGESWRGSILYSVLIVAAFYAIFILGLGTSIPHLF